MPVSCPLQFFIHNNLYVKDNFIKKHVAGQTFDKRIISTMKIMNAFLYIRG